MANEGEKSLREQQLEERMKRMKETNPQVERVRVSPASDELRKVLQHPSGLKFGPEGSVEWPLDQFTRRRIADGSVTREGDQNATQQPQKATQQPTPTPTPTPPQTPPQTPAPTPPLPPQPTTQATPPQPTPPQATPPVPQPPPHR